MRRPATKVDVPRGLGMCHNKLFCIGYVSMHCLQILYRIPHKFRYTEFIVIPNTFAFYSKIKEFFIKLRYNFLDNCAAVLNEY